MNNIRIFPVRPSAPKMEWIKGGIPSSSLDYKEQGALMLKFLFQRLPASTINEMRGFLAISYEQYRNAVFLADAYLEGKAKRTVKIEVNAVDIAWLRAMGYDVKED